VIEVNIPVGNNTGWLGKHWQSNDYTVGFSVNVTGYDGDKVVNNNPTQWVSPGGIKSSLPARLEYDCDTWKGSSGSPVYYNNSIAIAIHTYNSTVNGGTRITEWLYNYIDQIN
jgi:V8-like Glu-specific endopeptidase